MTRIETQVNTGPELPLHYEKSFILPQRRYWYHYEFLETFSEYFPYPLLKNEYHAFPNGMPLPLIRSSRESLLVQWVNDNWERAVIDISMIGSTLTYDGDAAGANTQRLGILFPFIDARQDKRAEKDIPDSDTKAIVRHQGVSTEMFARLVGHVAKANYIITFDIHSSDAVDMFERHGVSVINVLPLEIFAGEMIATWDIRNPEIAADTVIGTTDFGSLNRAYPYQQYIKEVYGVELPIVLISKHRVAEPNGTESHTAQQLLCGDLVNKNVFLIDDSYAQGGSSKEAVDITVKNGAKEIIIAATHPIFVGGYYSTLSKILENPHVRSVLTTDSLPFEDRWSGGVSVPYFDGKRVKVFSSAEFLARVSQIVMDHPVSDAIDQLGLHYFKPQRPANLAESVFGIHNPIKEKNAIYFGDDVIYTFDELLNDPNLIKLDK